MSPIELIALGFLLLGGGGKKDEEKGKVFKSDPGLKVPKGGLDAPSPAPEHEEAPYIAPHLEQPHVDAPRVEPREVVTAAMTPLQKAATTMASVLADRLNDGSGRGAYRVEDQEVYKTFQRQARVTSDGMPGKTTMNLLKGVLSTMSITLPAGLPIYPWKTSGGFHHPNAPEMREWDPRQVSNASAANAQAAKVAPPPPAATPISQATYSPEGGFKVPSTPTPVIATQPNEAAAAAMHGTLSKRMADGTGHGPYRKADVPVYRAFQSVAMKMSPDGFPGPGTMNALKTILASLGLSLPAGTPVFPFKKFDAPGDIKSKDWNAS